MTIRGDRTSMSPEHIRIAELAKEDRERKFSSIAHLLTVEALREAFKDLRKDGSAGVDRVTYTEYAAAVQENLEQPVPVTVIAPHRDGQSSKSRDPLRPTRGCRNSAECSFETCRLRKRLVREKC